MRGDVYSTTKPGIPYRAWLVAAFLLLLATALAGDMVRRGSGSWRAGDLIQPQGWDMSFRAPAQFHEVDPNPDQFDSTFVYEQPGRNGGVVRLTFWRLRAGEASANKVAKVIVESSRSWFSLVFGPPPTKIVGKLGGRDALEIVDPTVSLVLRTLVWDNGWAYAVSVQVEGGPLDERLYALFEMTCRSVRFQKSGAVKSN